MTGVRGSGLFFCMFLNFSKNDQKKTGYLKEASDSEEKKQIKYSENSDYFDLSESYCYNKGIKIQHQFQVKEGNVVDRNQGADNGIVRQILSLLPGGDCCGAGGCAMPACQDCAREMAERKRPDLCPACSQEAVDEIAALLQVPAVQIEKKIALILCAGEAAAAGAEAVESCKEAQALAGREGACQNGCLGLGSCIELCRFGAMKKEGNRILIDREKCNGCGACASEGACPRSLIVMVPREASNFIPCSSVLEEEDTRAICGYGCIGCGECEEACPEGAVHMVDQHAVIDYEKCVGCVACTVKCKKKIIVDTHHDLTKLKETVAFVGCSSGKAGGVFRREKLESCLNAVIKGDPLALGLCSTGCCGLGDCEKVCRFGAISVKEGCAWVDPEKCVGCGDCVYACPRGIIRMIPYQGTKLVPCSSTDDYEDKAQVCDSACIACGDCAANCPGGAITIQERHAVIDPLICENCQICQYMCPRKIIVEQPVEEYHYLQKDALGIEEGE